MREIVRPLLSAVMLCAASFAVHAQNQDINPRVDTSATPAAEDVNPRVDTSATPPADTARAPTAAKPPSMKPAATATPATPAPPKTAPAAPGSAPTAPGAAPTAPGAAKGKGKALDRLELDTTQITGNRELPKVLYIVPWKRADLGDLVGKPVNSLLDEVLTPVDRDVFQRENRYYRALTEGSSAPANGTGSQGGTGAAASAGSEGAGATSPPRNER